MTASSRDADKHTKGFSHFGAFNIVVLLAKWALETLTQPDSSELPSRQFEHPENLQYMIQVLTRWIRPYISVYLFIVDLSGVAVQGMNSLRPIEYGDCGFEFNLGQSDHVEFYDAQKWRWGRFSPRTSVSPANLHSICFSIIIFTNTRGWHNKPGVAAMPIASQTK
jgi:hypothetical protein